MQHIINVITKSFLILGVSLGLVGEVNAEADPKVWSLVKEALFAEREIQEVEFLKIEAPRRAESGAQVPVTYSLNPEAANGVVIKNIYAIVDANPIPLAATYRLSDMLGSFKLSTRVRFETDSFVRIVGESTDGKLYMAKREIRAAGGCGGMVDGDDAAIRAAAGKIKLIVEASEKTDGIRAAIFNIKHPMRTGLQRDLVSQGYIPAFFINKTVFTYNGKQLLAIDVGVGTSEDPYVKFNFKPAASGVLEVQATDNEGKAFVKQIEVNS